MWEYYSNATTHVAPTQPGPGGRVTRTSERRPTPPSLQRQDKASQLIEKSCKDASGVTAVTAKTSVNSAPMAGGSMRASAGPPSQRSAQGEPRPVAPGPSGSTYAAHNHTRARAHARARPRCTLQNTFPQHCTSTTTALFCICTLTCATTYGPTWRHGHGHGPDMGDGGTAHACDLSGA